MKNCTFCKIIRGELPSAKIWENDDFLAILDVNPNTKGMTLFLTKQHFDSYINSLPDGTYNKYFQALKKVTSMLEKGLAVKRVAVAIEGMAINHAHIKLYPLHGLKDKFEEVLAKDRVYFEKYEGFLSTQLGPTKNIGELRKLAEEIKSKTRY